ncbi:hypothetical protein [Govanella unica]|uniref:Uncharacterized protein n=1 Tax=Govanella unica TaxID=2975056 RepID=A0A9X3TXE7_9PROT|nr:hypothetical protein [Govania unica]MDA5193433.1 hypothetical protein [Govania unica]
MTLNVMVRAHALFGTVGLIQFILNSVTARLDPSWLYSVIAGLDPAIYLAVAQSGCPMDYRGQAR